VNFEELFMRLFIDSGLRVSFFYEFQGVSLRSYFIDSGFKVLEFFANSECEHFIGEGHTLIVQ
jgi:hypothetical protein